MTSDSPLPATACLDRAGRPARILTRVATAGAVLALAGWAFVIVTIAGLQDVPTTAARLLHGAQWVALAGVIPATIGLIVAVRFRAGLLRILGNVLLLMALIGTAWFALVFGVISSAASD